MYFVRWGPKIIAKFSRVYDGLNDVQRQRLLAALESLDAQLMNDPTTLGESRSSPLIRVAIERPLTIAFRIDEEQQVVRVSGASYFDREK